MSLTIERATESAAGAQDVNVRFSTYCVADDDGLWRVYGKTTKTAAAYLIGTIAEPK